MAKVDQWRVVTSLGHISLMDGIFVVVINTEAGIEEELLVEVSDLSE